MRRSAPTLASVLAGFRRQTPPSAALVELVERGLALLFDLQAWEWTHQHPRRGPGESEADYDARMEVAIDGDVARWYDEIRPIEAAVWCAWEELASAPPAIEGFRSWECIPFDIGLSWDLDEEGELLTEGARRIGAPLRRVAGRWELL